MSVLARRRADRSKNLVGFTVDNVNYAIDILLVREIIRPLEIVPIPHAPPAVLGVADHRGEVVPVLDMRRRFGLPPQAATRRTKWLIAAHAGRLVGLVIDSVTDVFGTADEEKRTVPHIGVGDAARGIRAVYSYDGKLVFVLDLSRIAAVTEMLDLGVAGALLEQQQGRRPR
ncbi:MAG: chemotaxis protein CheW [Sandaracinaceae bacterium]